MRTFGEWMRDSRKDRRLTQRECARAAGMTPQQWNEVERRILRPTPKTVKAVAIGLGASEKEALVAAGYTIPASLEEAQTLRLQALVMMAPPRKREHLIEFLESAGRKVIECYR